MAPRRETPMWSLKLVVYLASAGLMMAFLVVWANRTAPDEFGQVTPASFNYWAWIALILAAFVVAGSWILLLREIRRRMRLPPRQPSSHC